MLKAIKSFSDSYMNNQHCQEVYAKAKISEPGITNDMIDIANALGNKMADLQYALKEASHVEWKLEKFVKENPDSTIESNMDKLNDLVRYTQLSPHEKITESTEKTISLLKEKGYVIYSLDNKFVHPHHLTGYRGIHILAFSPCGQKIELQIHSPLSHDAKVLGHEHYKQISLCKLEGAEKEKAQEEVRKIHSSFDNPPGIEKIKGIYPPSDIIKYESKLNFNQECILSKCETSPDSIEIEGFIQDKYGEVVSSYSETTNGKDTIAVYYDNNGAKLYVSDPDRLEGMIENAVSECDMSLLSELEDCRMYLEGVSEKDTLTLSEPEQDIEIK